MERNVGPEDRVVRVVVGVGLLTWAVITTLRWRRFGTSRFEMSPATPGGQLTGTIHTRLDDVRSIRVTLKLTCLDRITRGSGKNRDTREHILWRDPAEGFTRLVASRHADSRDRAPDGPRNRRRYEAQCLCRRITPVEFHFVDTGGKVDKGPMRVRLRR